MAFGWNDFLILARKMIESNDQMLLEAIQRTAIGRTYYATFNLIMEEECEGGRMQRGGSASDHWRLQDHLERAGRHDASRRLHALRRLRNQSDYDLVVRDIDEMVRSALQIGEELTRS